MASLSASNRLTSHSDNIRQLVSFGAIGAASTVAYVALYALLREAASAGIANAIALVTTALGNTGFIGYPITAAVLGARGLPEAIFYDVFGTVCGLALVGLLVAQRFGHNDEARVNPLRELFTFPAVIALAIALATQHVAVPDAVMSGIGLLANMVAPLIMLSVGLSLRVDTLGSQAGPLAVLGGLRLLVAPLIGLAFGWILLGSGPALRVVVLESGMPAMMLTFVVGERFGLDTDFIASAIFVTTAAAALSLPLLQLVAVR